MNILWNLINTRKESSVPAISAQMRNIFEAWTFLGILYHLADTIVEPKNLTSSLYLGNLTVRKSATVVAAREDGQEFAFFLDTALPYYNSDSKPNLSFKA